MLGKIASYVLTDSVTLTRCIHYTTCQYLTSSEAGCIIISLYSRHGLYRLMVCLHLKYNMNKDGIR